ncbi:MAG: putative thiol:disulfide interchange protein DsbC precursor [Syntrophorhabdus sp. PtaU1.Bin058]|nr:MAG: putative thiol:disulfide interchange protein DsbC precursor [Syntrophorhabdus sp. PtaU1.Bin058]
MNKQVVRPTYIAFLLLGFIICGFASAGPIEESFKKMFPRYQFDSIRESDIKGVYEVIKGTDISLFVPEPGYLITGDFQMINREGKNVAELKRHEIVLSKIKSLPLDKALKVGSGENTVIEITDPDCPYCRRAAAFFEKRSDVTQYIFFFPLPYHKDAVNKIKYIFCSQDKEKAYSEATSGRLDNQKYEVCKKQDVDDLLSIHRAIVAKLGIESTPFFIINNSHIVVGADMPKLEEALKGKQ